MPEIVYAIPSYKRAERQETLEYLVKCAIPKERIYIYVQTEEDYNLYQRYAAEANIIFKEAGNVQFARNNILNGLCEKYDVLMLDDDIQDIKKIKGEGVISVEPENFEGIIQRCFEMARKLNGEIFGLYPIPDAFYMDKSISTRCTVNTAIGFIKGFKLRFDENFCAKEDIELCGRILNAGKRVIRYNFISPKAKHRTNKGGCSENWKSDVNKKAVGKLCIMYPRIFAMHRTKDSEVRVIAKDYKIKIGDKK